MFRKLRRLFWKSINKNREDVCAHCVWHRAEGENGVKLIPNAWYCDKKKKYTASFYSCSNFSKELFEATENSTQTKEMSVDLDLSLDLDK